MSPRPVPGSPQRREPFRMMLGHGLVAALVVLVLVGAVAWAAAGERAALAAVLGGMVAVTAFVGGLFGIRAIVDGHPGVSMAGALVVYLGQLIALVTLALVLQQQAWLDGRAFAIGLLVVGLAFQAGQITGFLRSRTLLADSGPAAAPPAPEPGGRGEP